MAVFRLRLVPRLLLFYALIISLTRSEGIQISFPQFFANYSTMMRAYGDIQYNQDHHSFILNANYTKVSSTRTCGLLVYGITKVLVQDIASSFSTSFTFKFTAPPEQPRWDDSSTSLSLTGSNLQFVMANVKHDSWIRDWAIQNSSCVEVAGMKGMFGIKFQNGYDYSKRTPSNNFIGISDRNNQSFFLPGATYNLCKNQTHCSYLTNGSSFTTWIDYTPERALEVRLLQESYGEKPLKPLWVISNYKLAPELGEYVTLQFVASSGRNNLVAHEVFDWTFNSNRAPEIKRSLTRIIWIASTLGVGGIVVVTTLALFTLYKLWHTRNHKAISYSLGTHIFSYKELRKATKNFSDNEKIGSGAFGTVYKGSLGNTLVAVKRINCKSKYAETSFHAEISSLALIRHRNIVQLQGWCHEKYRLLLVYDYMPNGNLNEWLHGSGGNHEHHALFSLKLRESILQEVATALEYMHSDCVQCVLHRDIKSSNVMLDVEFKAHIGDFGLARLMDHKKHDRTTMAAGTLGYMAPELLHTGKATKESDVYSFGILILEVVCGRQPIDFQVQEPKNLVLLHCIWQAHEFGMLLSMADSKLFQTSQGATVEVCHNDESTHCTMPTPLNTSHSHDLNDYKIPIFSIKDDVEVERIIKNLLHLGLMCCVPNPKARPTMKQVLQILQQVNNVDNVGIVITSLPPLPMTKPLELYSSIELL